MDKMTKIQRSYCMSKIKSKDSNCELIFRKTIWEHGFRGYRIHSNKIFGKPDIYFPKKKIAIFIDGCFWHKCPKCFIKPKSNNCYWKKKIDNNIKRDAIVNKTLDSNSIKVLRIWEHEINKNVRIALNKFLKLYENTN